ncbi:hypothetical protein [Halobellus marinus]|uniref:hypothetical protein n=1 Tax=Halobellus TaxID=1073986 RepID=UPI0036220AF2
MVHIHVWGILAIAYLRALRDTPVEARETGVHHSPTNSGGVHIEHSDCYDHARWFVRLPYLYHVDILRRRPTEQRNTRP